jgi:D-specific alpha-keto acid dehydrogenase
MAHREAASTGALCPAAPGSTITVYGCGPDEAVLLESLRRRLGVALTVTADALGEANAELAAGSRCVSIGHKSRVTNSTLRALSRAGVVYISARCIGLDHIDVAYAGRVGIRVENTVYSPDGVADYTVMLILMAVRQIMPIIRRAQLHDFTLNDRSGRELRDLTVAVIGAGRIGTAVVTRLRAFGARVLTHDRRLGSDALDTLLGRSDVVTLHAPLRADTHHLLNRQRFEQLKPGAIVVNTGRGSLLDTGALIAALESGRLGGAALDVLEGEEGIFYVDRRATPIDHKLLLRLQEFPNVVLTPHVAYHTDRALRDTVEKSIINCLNVERRTSRE